MGVTLIKFLDSAGAANRALYYLDEGESDLPQLYDEESVDSGSIAICPKNGLKWYLNSEKVWTRATIDIEGLTRTEGEGASLSYSSEINIPTVASVDVFPAYVEVKPGNTVQFIGRITGTNLVTEDIIWSIAKSTALDEGTTISKDGILTIAATQKRTKLQIIATSKDDLTTFGVGEVQIYTSGSQPPAKVSGVIISPRVITQSRGQTIRFKAEIAGNQSYDKSVHWELLGGTDSIIYQDGTVEIGEEEKASALIVKVSSELDPQYNDVATIVITDKGIVSPLGIVVEPKTATLKQGSTLTISATVDGSDSISKELIWEFLSTPTDNSTRISSNGILYVGKNERSNKITIRISSCQDTNIHRDITYNVIAQQDSGESEIQAIKFILAHGSIRKGESKQFVAIVSGINIQDESISYNISNTSSESTKISDSGILYVSTDEKSTSVLVTAVSNEDPSKEEMSVVIIKPIGDGSGDGDKDKEKYVPEVDLTPVNQFYVRGVNACGVPVWKPVEDIGGIEDAPTDVVGEAYVRKTTAKGKNEWVKANTLEDAPTTVEGAQYVRKTINGENKWVQFTGGEGEGLPSMTKEEWNALAPAQRPTLAHIKENWLRPIKTYITDENGYLY